MFKNYTKNSTSSKGSFNFWFFIFIFSLSILFIILKIFRIPLPLIEIKNSNLSSLGPSILIVSLKNNYSEKQSPGFFNEKSEMPVNEVTYIRKLLKKVKKDLSIQALIMHIYGVYPLSSESEEIFLLFKKFKKETNIPIFAVLENSAIKGSYVIASLADKIFSNRSTLLGDFSVTSIYPFLKEFFKKLGIKQALFRTDDLKALGSEFGESSFKNKKQMEFIKTYNESFLNIFIEMIKEGRKNKTKLKDIMTYTNGKIFSALQAYDMKLVDELGLLENCIDDMKTLLKDQTLTVIKSQEYLS